MWVKSFAQGHLDGASFQLPTLQLVDFSLCHFPSALINIALNGYSRERGRGFKSGLSVPDVHVFVQRESPGWFSAFKVTSISTKVPAGKPS